MGINTNHYGLDLYSDKIFISEGNDIKPDDIAITKRTNIDYASESKGLPWRFCLYDCYYVSIPVRRMNKRNKLIKI